MARHPILVVEDNEDVRDIVVEVLRYEGFDVSSARDGQEALEELVGSAAPPCLILLDLMMPRMDGPTFRRRQLADPTIAGIPVILLSSHEFLEEETGELRATAFIRKPANPEELVRAVRAHC